MHIDCLLHLDDCGLHDALVELLPSAASQRRLLMDDDGHIGSFRSSDDPLPHGLHQRPWLH